MCHPRVRGASCQSRRCLFPVLSSMLSLEMGAGSGATERSWEQGGDLFSSEGRMQSRHFVFRTLCNILK